MLKGAKVRFITDDEEILLWLYILLLASYNDSAHLSTNANGVVCHQATPTCQIDKNEKNKIFVRYVTRYEFYLLISKTKRYLAAL